MVENKEKITIGRRSAGYAFSLCRSGCSESELEGYLMNTKKDVDADLVLCMFHWLRSIAKELPTKTLEAWGGAGSARKPFFNWFYTNLKRKAAFQSFAFDWLKEQEKEAAALSAQSAYGQDVDYSGFSDLADYDPARVKSDFESWILSGAGVPAVAGDNGAGAVNTPF